jgi:hypothetical protein
MHFRFAYLVSFTALLFSGCNSSESSSESQNLASDIVSEVALTSDIFEGTNRQGNKILFKKSLSNDGDTVLDFRMDEFITIDHPIGNGSICYLQSKSPIPLAISTYELVNMNHDQIEKLKVEHADGMAIYPMDQQEYFGQILKTKDNVYDSEELSQEALLKLVKDDQQFTDWVFIVKENKSTGIIGTWLDIEVFNQTYRFFLSNAIDDAYNQVFENESGGAPRDSIIQECTKLEKGTRIKVTGKIEGDKYGYNLALQNVPRIVISDFALF